jgi:hypothetical protein
VISRHRSPSYDQAYLADGGVSAVLRYAVDTKTREPFRLLRSIAHCTNAVTQGPQKTALSKRL